MPQFLQVELTYACNSSCSFCYNPNHGKQLDESVRERILRRLNDYRLRHVQLIGGEVTLLSRLPQYLDALSDCSWRSLVTNGRIFVPELEGRVDEIYLSMHGTPQMHERITRALGSFSSIENSIVEYVRMGIRVHSDTVLTAANAECLRDVGRQARQLGMHTLFVNVFQPAGIGSHFEDALTPSLSQFRRAIDDMLWLRDDLGLSVSFGTSTPFCLDERLVTENLAFRCGTGQWFASVDPLGELRICNQSSRSYGNVLNTPLHQIWQSRVIDQEYRSLDWMQAPCTECPFQADCLGGCRIGDDGAPRIDPMVAANIDDLVKRDRLVRLRGRLRLTATTTHSG